MITENPTWEYFREHVSNPTNVFESEIAKRLFCVTVGVQPEALEFPPNFPGIECLPVLTEEGWASFQAKYSHDGKPNIAEFDCLDKAYKCKSDGQYQLDVVYCYSAGAATAAKKRQDIERLAEQNGVRLVWRFADQILEQLRDSADPLVIRAKRKFFEELPQPELTVMPRIEAPQGVSKYHYSQQSTPLVGRDEEIAELSGFLCSEAKFLWWGVIGKGGSGKSRLLLELGNTLSEHWQWGWLTDNTLSRFDFANWIPNKQTLLIADYVTGQEQEIGNLLNALFGLEQNKRLHHVVRLLLIEREAGQWFKTLKNLKSIRTWVQASLYRNNLLQISQLDYDSLIQLANSLTGSQQNGQSDPELLVEKALATSPERAPLVMQLLAASEQIDNTELVDLIREFIERDKLIRWDIAEVSENLLEVLTVATMCGGINLNTVRWNLPSTRDYFASFTDFEKYCFLVGQPSISGQLEALEPDLFGELFVLDRLSSYLQNPLSSKHKHLLSLAMTINEGRATVGFFSKCFIDYPLHPAFSVFSSPPEGKLYDSAWTIPKHNPIHLIWLLIAANTIDAPAISQQQKISVYVAIVNSRHPRNGAFMTLLEQVAFVRLLNLYSETKKIQKYIENLEITDEIVIPSEPVTDDLLDQFYSDEYCDDIIAEFIQLPEDAKLTILGPHIVRIYHHKIIRLLSSREVELQQILSLYREILAFLDRNYPNNYLATIPEFHHLSVNFIAALSQYNHTNRKPELCMQIAEIVSDDVRRVSKAEIKGQPVFMHSGWKEQIVVVMTIIARRTHLRDYQYLLDLMGILDSYLALNENNTASILNYVKASVQLAYGFRSQEDYNCFHEIYRRCVDYTDRFPSKDMASSLGMIHIQLYRNKCDYYTDDDKYDFLAAAIELAKKFPEDEVDLLRTVLRELSGAYRDSMKDGKFEVIHHNFETALSLIQELKYIKYSDNRKIYCCDLVRVGLYSYLESGLYLDQTERAMEVIQNSSVATFEGCLNQVPSELFSRAQRSIRQGEKDISERCKICLKLLQPYFSYIPQLLEALPSV
jgi:hypothetical protein